VTDSEYEPETSESCEKIVSDKILKSFNENQAPPVQLCHLRAHQRDTNNHHSNIFLNLKGGSNDAFVGRPHAQSLQ